MKNFFIWNKNGFSNTATFMFYSYHQINIIFSWPELMNGFFQMDKKDCKKGYSMALWAKILKKEIKNYDK